MGMVLSPSQIEFYLNYSQHSIQIFTPFLEGTQTSQRSLISFFYECFSFSLTEANNILRSLFSLAKFIQSEAYPKEAGSSYLQGCFGEVCALLYSFTFMFFLAGMCQSSDELLPNYFFLFTKAYLRLMTLSFLYFSLSFLNSVSGSGVFLEESVLEPSLLMFCLMIMGCLWGGGSSSELEESANSFFMCISAYFFLAFLQARQICFCFLSY